ncbi:hamartin isoform X2 [Nasonia vitripennis]|uniref:Hamartin n=1 Tax=Nasonia vitripennis TaxID=7425 RepID=A0A7M7R0S2_NASVI|nr:hamartin isoform X2 [Nasonia vitripennis]XP_032455607.1 hamartin isoform X2 [Nasonia vitripennis]
MTNNNANSSTGVAELFHMLESNKLSEVEEIKKVFHDHFLSTKDNWLVNGLFDYYLSTDSLRAVEVLAGVREPHDKHLFDRLTETLTAKPANNGQKVRTLTLLGHVARRQPTWLFKLASHTLFRQLLHLLKVEEDIVLLMSALLLLITLLPMLPTALTPHLNEIFEVFSRLASFHYHRFISISSAYSVSFSTISMLNQHGGCDADQLYLLHVQVGLHHLFYRLYAMYPCNFVSFLKQQYLQRDQLAIFKKIISPMLDSVRMHPLLVTMSKDSEISSSRWKKMEHHDVVAECGRFSLLERSNRDEAGVPIANMRFTPISDYSCPYTPISSNSEFPMVMENTGLPNGSQDGSFWSPSMVVSPQSPPPANSLQATPLSQHEAKSTPTTPGAASLNISTGSTAVSNRSRTSPPEAAVEATPETTPVKDARQMPGRQLPVGSAAVRALSAFGNNGLLSGATSSSRPSTPTPVNHLVSTPSAAASNISAALFSSLADSGSSSSIFDRKLNKIVADRQNAQQSTMALKQEEQVVVTSSTTTSVKRMSTPTATQMMMAQVTTEQVNAMLNGRVEMQQHQLEDQEVSDIVSARRSTLFETKDCSEKERQTFNDLSRKVLLKFYCKNPTPVPSSKTRRRAKSCPDMESISRPEDTSERSTQTCGLLPYECFFLDILDQRASNEAQANVPESARLSPSAMLERYIEVCSRNTGYGETKCRSKQSWPGGRRSTKPDDEENSAAASQLQQQQQQSANDDVSSESSSAGCWGEMDRANQQIQLMLMQLQFERQRREVHAERNRRLLGKLRDSRALEELNTAMTKSLKISENEIEALKSELSRSKLELRTELNKQKEAIHHWQTKCNEEQQRNAALNDRIESLEDELKSEKKKVTDHESKTRAAEATLFEAAHQLKEALRAANQSEELKRVLEAVQKRFLLLGEAQARIQEKINAPVHMARQEAAQIQRSWSEEVSSLRRQLDSQTLHLESLKARLADLEHKDARKEVQLVDQQRLLQESKEKHSAELEAVESKYKAQMEINLLLEGRILELHGKLEQATFGMSSSSGAVNLASSASPKERSPPLSASLASSSEGSLAFIHSAMNDCCDPAGEIANLQAIVEPAAGPSSSAGQVVITSTAKTIMANSSATAASQR